MTSISQKRSLRAAALTLTVAAAWIDTLPAAAQGVPELRKRLDQEIADRQAADEAAAKAAQAATEALRAQLLHAIKDGDAATQKAALALFERALQQEGLRLRQLIADGDTATLAASKAYTDAARSALLDALALERAERLADRTLLEPRVLPPCGPNETVKFDGSSWVCSPAPADPGRPAATPAAHHAAILALDGKFAGWLGAASGGKSTTAIGSPGGGSTSIVTYDDIIVTLDHSGISEGLWQWLSDFVASRPSGLAAKSGTVCRLDATGAVAGALDFQETRLVAFELPAIDKTSAGPCWITLTLRPTATRLQRASSVPFEKKPEPKQPGPCACALQFPGMSSVESVGAMAVQRSSGSATQHGGDAVTIQPLSIAVASEVATPWFDWYESFVFNGQNQADQHKSGALVLLDGSGGELFRLNLQEVGIFSAEQLASRTQFGFGLYVGAAELVMPRDQ